MAYITESDIEKYMGLTIDSALSSFIVTLISAAQKYIEKYTSRVFEASAEDVTRKYSGKGTTKMRIDDLLEITSLEADGVDLEADDDYLLCPLNASADGEPYTWIELIQPETRLPINPRMNVASRYVFDKAQGNVTIVGTWGYSVTPPEDIKVAALKIVSGIIKENIGDSDLKEITQESIGEYSTSYAKVRDIANATGVNDILDQYVRADAPRNNQVNGNGAVTGNFQIS